MYYYISLVIILLFLIVGIIAKYALNEHTINIFPKNKIDKLLIPTTLDIFFYYQ